MVQSDRNTEEMILVSSFKSHLSGGVSEGKSVANQLIIFILTASNDFLHTLKINEF